MTTAINGPVTHNQLDTPKNCPRKGTDDDCDVRDVRESRILPKLQLEENCEAELTEHKFCRSNTIENSIAAAARA